MSLHASACAPFSLVPDERSVSSAAALDESRLASHSPPTRFSSCWDVAPPQTRRKTTRQTNPSINISPRSPRSPGLDRAYPPSPHMGTLDPVEAPRPVTKRAENEHTHSAKRGLTETGRAERLESAQRAQRLCHPRALERYRMQTSGGAFALGNENEEESSREAAPMERSLVEEKTTKPMRNTATMFSERDVRMVRAIALAMMEEKEKEMKRRNL